MGWLAALPDLVTAAGLLLVWLRPDLTGTAWVGRGVATVLLEFFVIHAGGFFAVVLFGGAPRLKRSLYLGGLAALYLPLVAAYAWAMHAWWMVGAFLWLGFTKVQAVWGGRVDEDRERKQWAAMVTWAASVVAYLGAVCASAFVDWPEFGVTPAVRAAAGFSGGGLWEAHPHTALAGGVLYFCAMALVRMLVRDLMFRSKS
ncbi:MAG: hypothetical protein P4L83_06030 [Nevskia sp.]|nr:hypothetical protein [Nevskia sp.]